MPGDGEEKRTLDTTAAGRTLSRPIKDAHGRTLLPRDTVLSQEQLGRLARLGIEAVWLKKHAGAAAVADTLAGMFEGVRDDPLMAAIEQASRRILEQEAGA